MTEGPAPTIRQHVAANGDTQATLQHLLTTFGVHEDDADGRQRIADALDAEGITTDRPLQELSGNDSVGLSMDPGPAEGDDQRRSSEDSAGEDSEPEGSLAESGDATEQQDEFSPGDQAIIEEVLGPAGTRKGALRRGFKLLPRTLPYLKPYKWKAALSIVLTVLLAVLALAEPWPLAFTVDSIIGDKAPPAWVDTFFGDSVGGLIALAVVATLLLTLLGGGLTVLNEYLTTTVDQRMVLDLRSEMFDHAQKLSLSFHDGESKGILMYRINDQAAAMGQLVTSLPLLGQNLLTVIGMAYISVKINPLLALLALGTTPFVVYSTMAYTDRIEPRLYRVRGLGAINLSIVYEAMAMIRVVLAFGTQKREYNRFRKQGEHFTNEVVGLTVRQTAFKLLVQTITAAGTAAVIGVGAYQAIKGQITAGELLVIVSYIHKIYQPLEELTTTITSFQQWFINLMMSFDLLDKEPDIKEKPDARPLPYGEGGIELENVCFDYPGRADVLTDVSFEIPSGKAIALVGPTGAGKSTLTSLLPRFYDPTRGTVRIDGHDTASSSSTTCAASSASCSRSHGCSRAPSRTTSATPSPRPRWTR